MVTETKNYPDISIKFPGFKIRRTIHIYLWFIIDYIKNLIKRRSFYHIEFLF